MTIDKISYNVEVIKKMSVKEFTDKMMILRLDLDKKKRVEYFENIYSLIVKQVEQNG